jgi:hypothetical protein
VSRIVGQYYMVEYTTDMTNWFDALSSPVIAINDSTTVVTNWVPAYYFRVVPVSPDPFSP